MKTHEETIAYATGQYLDLDKAEGLDGFARRGVALSRDAAHLTIVALRNYAHDLGTRPCEANDREAERCAALSKAITSALASS